jgi:hypothetical protein
MSDYPKTVRRATPDGFETAKAKDPQQERHYLEAGFSLAPEAPVEAPQSASEPEQAPEPPEAPKAAPSPVKRRRKRRAKG